MYYIVYAPSPVDDPKLGPAVSKWYEGPPHFIAHEHKLQHALWHQQCFDQGGLLVNNNNKKRPEEVAQSSYIPPLTTISLATWGGHPYLPL